MPRSVYIRFNQADTYINIISTCSDTVWSYSVRQLVTSWSPWGIPCTNWMIFSVYVNRYMLIVGCMNQDLPYPIMQYLSAKIRTGLRISAKIRTGQNQSPHMTLYNHISSDLYVWLLDLSVFMACDLCIYVNLATNSWIINSYTPLVIFQVFVKTRRYSWYAFT